MCILHNNSFISLQQINHTLQPLTKRFLLCFVGVEFVYGEFISFTLQLTSNIAEPSSSVIAQVNQTFGVNDVGVSVL